MVTLFSVISLGFFLGMRHATDPDHVIAVSTIVDQEPTLKKASLVGIFWGVGHTATIVFFGGIVILFSIVIPPALDMSLELGVAAMLIFLGIINLKGFNQWLRQTFRSSKNKTNTHSDLHHSHHHRHGDYIHSHAHGHEPEAHGHDKDDLPTTWLDKKFGHWKFYRFIRPVIIGVVHGFAGTAALMLMVVPMIQNAYLAMLYLLLFGIGTITGMMLITAAIALPFIYSSEKSPIFNRTNLRMVAGLFSLGFGIFLVYEIGFVRGLFI